MLPLHNPLQKRCIARSGVSVSRLGLGGVGLGDPGTDRTLTERQSDAIVEAAWESGIAYFDTSPWYGCGKSELRLGHVLRGRPRASFTLSTKVGRVLVRPPAGHEEFRHPRWPGGLGFDVRFDYTRAGVLRSYEQSLMRLGINKIDVLYVHDLDRKYHASDTAFSAAVEQLDEGGGWGALADLRASGEIGAIGFGINRAGLVRRFLERFDPDVFLIAMPYTLLDQNGKADLDACHQRGASVVIGSPFASGVLATGATAEATYDYTSLTPEAGSRVRRLAAVCDSMQVPMPAAALQFPFGHPAVVSVLAGAVDAVQVRHNLELMGAAIPERFWSECKRQQVIAGDCPTP